MANTKEVKIVSGFSDDTNRDLKLPVNPETANADIKAKIKAVDADAIKDIYLSEGGASFTGITAATIFEVTENEINLNVSGE